MRTYELVFVVKTTLAEAQRKKLVETVKGFLKGTKITKEEEWGQKAFAYPIKHENNGFYFVFSLESEGSIPLDLEKKLLSNEAILRHLLVRKK